MGLWNAIKRRDYKASIVAAIDAKYGINIRAEARFLSSPAFEEMLDTLYDMVPPHAGPRAKIVGMQVLEEMLAARSIALTELGKSAKLRRKHNGK